MCACPEEYSRAVGSLGLTIPRDPVSVNKLKSVLEHAMLVTKLQAIYLHGSWGTSLAREESDIDLAILAEAGLGFEDRSTIFREVYTAFGGQRDIDVSELLHANSVFAAQVITDGERIVTADRGAVECFEMITLAKYARLNEERAGIIEDVQRRGTIYLTGNIA